MKPKLTIHTRIKTTKSYLITKVDLFAWLDLPLAFKYPNAIVRINVGGVSYEMGDNLDFECIEIILPEEITDSIKQEE